jgi:FkbM family methyltransferase
MVIGRHLGEGISADRNGELRLIKLVAPASTNFIDIGANVGDWTDHFLNAGEGEMRGLLIEPSSSAISRLERRFQGRANIRIIQAAVAEQRGEGIFHEEADAGETSSLIGAFSKADSAERTVQITTIDEEAAAAGFSYVDMLKIDTEGYDFHVLRGAERMLSEGRIGIIQFEYNFPWSHAGSTLSAAMSFLDKQGFRLFLLRSTGLHPFDYRRYGEFFSYSNFVAASAQKLPILESMIRTTI